MSFEEACIGSVGDRGSWKEERLMKHVRDPDEWQHESMFTCLNCKKLIEFNSLLEGMDGPDDCSGNPQDNELLEAVRNMYPEFEIRRRRNAAS